MHIYKMHKLCLGSLLLLGASWISTGFKEMDSPRSGSAPKHLQLGVQVTGAASCLLDQILRYARVCDQSKGAKENEGKVVSPRDAMFSSWALRLFLPMKAIWGLAFLLPWCKCIFKGWLLGSGVHWVDLSTQKSTLGAVSTFPPLSP